LVAPPTASLELPVLATIKQLPVAVYPSRFDDWGRKPTADVEFLTNLRTTWAFRRELEDAAKQAKTIAFIQANLDKFGDLVVSNGLKVGDDLLRTIGSIFLRACGPLSNRCVGPCRSGGDEFTLALLDMDEAAAGLAEGLREWIATLQPSVTARFVVVTGVSDIGDMLRIAHSVLYPRTDLKIPNTVTSRSKREFPDDE
jgi:GGDEF domain-containing protein